MLIRDDTIAALSTAPGRAAIAVVRVSGPEAHAITRRLTLEWPAIPRHVVLSQVRNPDTRETIDTALITRFDAPHSYTGEHMVELACHGGVAVTGALLLALWSAGARAAEPGEFTQRAVLNGKLDLIQAEAIGDLIEARTNAMRSLALRQLEGGLSRRLAGLRESVLQVEALLAYDIDFPEEDDGPIARESISWAIRATETSVTALLATTPLAELSRDGALVVIAGPPNVGKSSLFNALLGESRAIVTEIPGTTRDALEARVEAGRWPLRLIDTAGLRSTDDPLERMGIEVSRRYLEEAQVVLACAETGADLTRTLAMISGIGNGVRIAVRTKVDLAGEASGDGLEPVVPVSAHTGRGLQELLRKIEDGLDASVREIPVDLPVVTRGRQVEALKRAAAELAEFRVQYASGRLPASIAAVHLRAAVHELDELVGKIETDEILARVFSTFCVGK
jgi:tRNA modification GTPase